MELLWVGSAVMDLLLSWPFVALLCLGALSFHVITGKLIAGGVYRSKAQGPLEVLPLLARCWCVIVAWQGVVVIDLSVVVAGPMASEMLAGMGAEVIKVMSLLARLLILLALGLLV